MPAPLAVNWNEVKTLALAIGVREAARQLELSEEAVMKRCSREGWLKQRDRDQEFAETALAEKRQRQGMSATVRTAAEVLASMGDDTRAKLAIGVNKGAQAVADMDGQEVLLASQQVQQLTKAAATVHGWQSSGPSLSVRLDVIAQSGPEAPVIDV
jgi:membrane carboxypeptidase/penicillin-binding protein